LSGASLNTKKAPHMCGAFFVFKLAPLNGSPEPAARLQS